MVSYSFTDETNTTATRVADDGSICAIPWSPDPSQPLDEGVWQRQWVEDGSPQPAPYVPPAREKT
jgi:hypothetical protein